MKRLAFLGVGSAIILGLGVISATPAFADNGPHVSTSGNMTIDRCAACHRAHTAQDTYLLKSAQTSLCETCHGHGVTGATTDVIDGYSTNGGALRGGGFDFALLDGASGVNRTSINALSSGVASTSKHDVGVSGTAWGGGPSGSDGVSITLECGSCHDPHGNGNFRILRPVPEDGTAWTFPAPVSVSTVTFDHLTITEGRYKFYYVVAVGSTGTFKVTQPVTILGSTGGADAIIGGTVEELTDATHMLVSGANVVGITGYTQNPDKTYSLTGSQTPATGGNLGYADPAGIASASGNGATVTFKTWNLHGLVTGQLVTITGIAPVGYNVTKAAITVVDMTTFTVANATTGAMTAYGTISGGIPDAIAKVYTTTNYWLVDDHNYTGVNKTAQLTATNTAANGGPTAFIANVSQWCTTCHTRILAGSGAWKTDSGDGKFRFMHRSQSAKESSPNCITCHVAHGTSAQMSGGYSSGVGTEITGHAGDSFLLRVNNRGTCNMCHNL